jgi:L-malate glycosyltransferase
MPASALSRPLRILYMIDELEAITAGGTERQVLQMIALMKDAGAEVELCLLRNTPWLTTDMVGAPIHRCHLGSIFSPAGLLGLNRLRQWIRERRFDVVQTFFIDANIVGPIVARLAGTPLVLGSRRNLNYWMTPFTSRAQRFSNLFVSRLVANCAAVRDAVAHLEHFDDTRIDVVYNGLDLTHFRPDPALRETTRARLGLNPEEVLVGNVSVLRPIKGCEMFLEAAKLVRESLRQARFILVGDGPLRNALEAQARRLGIAEAVIFAGSQEDVRPYLNAFDIAVLSSESEGFSNSILEYLAYGLPTVVTDAGGNAEAVGNAGRVVSVGDGTALAGEIVWLASDAERCNLLKNLALDRAKSFGLVATQARLVQIYER